MGRRKRKPTPKPAPITVSDKWDVFVRRLNQNGSLGLTLPFQTVKFQGIEDGDLVSIHLTKQGRGTLDFEALARTPIRTTRVVTIPADLVDSIGLVDSERVTITVVRQLGYVKDRKEQSE